MAAGTAGQVYWQIGDSSTAREFYQDHLRGIAGADPAVTGLYEVPDLTARWDYERGNLVADLRLADGDPALAQAAQAYLAGAREEFWLEAARLDRRRLTPSAEDETGGAGEDGTEAENTGDGPGDRQRRPARTQDHQHRARHPGRAGQPAAPALRAPARQRPGRR